MSNRAERRQELRRAQTYATTPLAQGPQWGVWVSPHVWVSTYRGGRPAWWFRWWQRVLLGWRWEQRGL